MTNADRDRPHADRVYRRPHDQIADFAFDEAVAAVFPDMIRRSIPGYEVVVPLTGLLAARHLRVGDTALDLGCSLGATTLAIARQLGAVDARVIGVDDAPAMLERARAVIDDARVSFRLDDLTRTPIDGARVVVLNFALQFVAPDQRLPLLARLRREMAPDGLLLVAEKIRYDDTARQAFHDAAHLDFKRANGYSELEISQKRTALENVMIVDTEQIHRDRFAAAGFTHAERWWQCLNWAAFAVT